MKEHALLFTPEAGDPAAPGGAEASGGHRLVVGFKQLAPAPLQRAQRD